MLVRCKHAMSQMRQLACAAFATDDSMSKSEQVRRSVTQSLGKRNGNTSQGMPKYGQQACQAAGKWGSSQYGSKTLLTHDFARAGLGKSRSPVKCVGCCNWPDHPPHSINQLLAHVCLWRVVMPLQSNLDLAQAVQGTVWSTTLYCRHQCFKTSRQVIASCPPYNSCQCRELLDTGWLAKAAVTAASLRCHIHGAGLAKDMGYAAATHGLRLILPEMTSLGQALHFADLPDLGSFHFTILENNISSNSWM